MVGCVKAGARDDDLHSGRSVSLGADGSGTSTLKASATKVAAKNELSNRDLAYPPYDDVDFSVEWH